MPSTRAGHVERSEGGKRGDLKYRSDSRLRGCGTTDKLGGKRTDGSAAWHLLRHPESGRQCAAQRTRWSKYASWDDVYRKDGAETAIGRYMRGGTRNQIEQAIADTVGAPDVVRRVFIVTSSLSRADVADGFARAADVQPVRPHFVQLYWILMGFFSACAEIGAIGYVVCQP